MSSVEAVTRSQEQLSEVRCLPSTGPRAGQRAPVLKAAQHSQIRRAPPHLPPPAAASVAPQAEDGSGAKRHHRKNRGVV